MGVGKEHEGFLVFKHRRGHINTLLGTYKIRGHLSSSIILLVYEAHPGLTSLLLLLLLLLLLNNCTSFNSLHTLFRIIFIPVLENPLLEGHSVNITFFEDCQLEKGNTDQLALPDSGVELLHISRGIFVILELRKLIGRI